MKKIEDNNAEIAKLEPRIQTLTKAQEATLQWSDILQHLRDNMPEGVWLTGVSCQKQNPNDPIAVSLKGMSTSQQAVGHLIIRIELCNDLESPELVFTQERRTENGKALEFEVKGQLAGSAPETAKTKEVKA
jgi:Tfp pilus assembly protein PilN